MLLERPTARTGYPAFTYACETLGAALLREEVGNC